MLWQLDIYSSNGDSMKTNILFGAALLLLTGCFSGGLPEYFASEKKSELFPSGVKPQAMVLSAEDGSEQETLGHQYVFGIFPVTQLFITHGPQVFLEEQLADVLADLNYDVLRVKGGDLETVAALPADLKMAARFSELSLNAYDLIFQRRLAVQAKLEFACADGQKFRRYIDQSDLKSTAHVDEMAAYLRHVLRDELSAAVHECEKNSVRTPQAPAKSIKAVRIEFPSGDISPSVLTAFQNSYGRNNRKTFSAADLKRITQRGAERALADHYPLVLSAGPGSRNEKFQTDHLSLTLDHLQVDDSLQLTLIYKLLAQKLTCVVNEPLDKDRDGYLVWALESAAEKATARALGGDIPGVSCEAGS